MLQKSAVIEAVLDALRSEFENYVSISKKTRATGNDAETKAEGKYDTRSTEENYLADGLAKHALAASQAIEAISSLPLTASLENTPISLGSLVEIAFPTETLWFLIAPAAGGMEVEVSGQTVTVLSPESPLGQQLKGQTTGGKTRQPVTKILRVL